MNTIFPLQSVQFLVVIEASYVDLSLNCFPLKTSPCSIRVYYTSVNRILSLISFNELKIRLLEELTIVYSVSAT